MDAAATLESPSGGLSRALLFIAALRVLVTGLCWATSWIDTGSDSTCGSAIRTRMWLDDGRSTCREVTTLRASIGGALIVAAGALMVAASRRRQLATRHAALVSATAAVASTVTLIAIETVP